MPTHWPRPSCRELEQDERDPAALPRESAVNPNGWAFSCLRGTPAGPTASTGDHVFSTGTSIQIFKGAVAKS